MIVGNYTVKEDTYLGVQYDISGSQFPFYIKKDTPVTGTPIANPENQVMSIKYEYPSLLPGGTDIFYIPISALAANFANPPVATTSTSPTNTITATVIDTEKKQLPLMIKVGIVLFAGTLVAIALWQSNKKTAAK